MIIPIKQYIMHHIAGGTNQTGRLEGNIERAAASRRYALKLMSKREGRSRPMTVRRVSNDNS